jgi:hypothetical protein
MPTIPNNHRLSCHTQVIIIPYSLVITFSFLAKASTPHPSAPRAEACSGPSRPRAAQTRNCQGCRPRSRACLRMRCYVYKMCSVCVFPLKTLTHVHSSHIHPLSLTSHSPLTHITFPSHSHHIPLSLHSHSGSKPPITRPPLHSLK